MRTMVVFLFVMGLLLTGGCGEHHSRGTYPMKIEIVNGITTVMNPGYPRDGVKQFTLKEVLSIGSEEQEDDNYLLARPRDMAFDSKGNIYVIDFKLKQIKVFDSQGKFLLAFGKEGKGPGELVFPFGIAVDKKKEIVLVLDYTNRKVSHYSLGGSFFRDVMLKKSFGGNFYFYGDPGYIFVSNDIDEEKKQVMTANAYSKAGELLYSSQPFLRSPHKMVKVDGWYITTDTHWDPKGHYAFNQQGDFYYGFSGNYRFQVFSADMNKKRVIAREKPEPLEIPKVILDKFMAKMNKKGIKSPLLKVRKDFPTHYANYTEIEIDNLNRLIVRLPSNDGKIHMDVFDPQGIYIEKWIIDYPFSDIPLDTNLLYRHIKDDHIFCIAKDDNGTYNIKKYKLSPTDN